MNEFKVQLNFASFLKLSIIIGGCMGLGSAPLIAIFNWSQLGIGVIPVALLATPLAGLFNGLLGGLIGFPVYFWLSRKVGFRFKGHLYLEPREG